MNVKRTLATGIATVWLFIAHFGSHEHAHIVGFVVANIWLAAALLVGGKK